MSLRWIIAVLTACVVVLAICKAHARDLGQWDDSETSQWFATLMQPDHPTVSCCGDSDAYWADGVEVVGGQVFAIITDARPDEPLRRMHVPVGTKILIPPHKYKFDKGNPTGHTVVFLSLSRDVYCFVQNGGV